MPKEHDPSVHGQKDVLGFLESQETFHSISVGVVTNTVISPHVLPAYQTSGKELLAVKNNLNYFVM